MSAFNAQFVDQTISFLTLEEVRPPSPPPKGILFKSQLTSGGYGFRKDSMSNEQIEWYRHNLVPELRAIEYEEIYTIHVYRNEITIFDIDHRKFKWIIDFTEFLKTHIPKYPFGINRNVSSTSYCNALFGNPSNIIKQAIDEMYKRRALNAFVLTTIYRGIGGCSWRWNHKRDTNECVSCYLKEVKPPYGIFLLDAEVRCLRDNSHNHAIECVIYDITPEVIDWFVLLRKFFPPERNAPYAHSSYIGQIRFKDIREYGAEYAPSCCRAPLNDNHVYLSLERFDLLVKLMKEEPNLLNKIYGIPSLFISNESVVDIPPTAITTAEVQTEPPKGLLSRIFGL